MTWKIVELAEALVIYIYIYIDDPKILFIINYILVCNTYKRIDAFKIKHNFYYKNINNYSNY